MRVKSVVKNILSAYKQGLLTLDEAAEKLAEHAGFKEVANNKEKEDKSYDNVCQH